MRIESLLAAAVSVATPPLAAVSDSPVTTLLFSVFGGAGITAVGTFLRARSQNRREDIGGKVELGTYEEKRLADRDDRIDELQARIDALEKVVDEERRLRRAAEDDTRGERARADAAEDHVARLQEQLVRVNRRVEALERRDPAA